ncbi:hypothetical protein Tco_1040149, partial [Tanacetum coccineum]
GNPQIDLQDQGVIDSGCSRHMKGNMSYLTNYEEIYGGYVAFGQKLSMGSKYMLVDGKKIIVTEAYVRRDLQLEDEEGKGFSGRVTPLFPTMVVQHQSQMGEGSANITDLHHTPTIIQPSTQPKRHKNLESLKERTLRYLSLVILVTMLQMQLSIKLGDSLVRVATTASSLEAEQDSGARETTGDILLKLGIEELCTHFTKKVRDLEKIKDTQANEIASLKRGVKKLKKKISSRTHKLKRLYKVGLIAKVESSRDEEDLGEDASKQGKKINVIDVDEDITLVNVQNDADNEMFDVNA